MHYSHGEHVLEGGGYLQDIRPYFDFGNELVGLSNLLYVVLQVAFFGPLHRDKHFVVLDEAL